MQTLFEEDKKRGVVLSGLSMVGRNKRYIFWFWLLNLTLAEFGTAAFRRSAHVVLDHSSLSDRLVHGFDVAVFIELLVRPEFGQTAAMTTPALYFAFLFFVSTALFLPGVFLGYASNYRLPRADFFRACGRNLWRYIRVLIVAGIVMGVAAGALFALNGAIVKKAGESTNEVLPFELQMSGLAVIFLVMTILRIWFDLTEADVVLDDQRAIRKSVFVGLRHTFGSLGRLLASYVLVTIVAAAILVGGLLIWLKFVSPESVLGAFIVSQFTLFLLLIPRFWQRGIVVSYWQQKMMSAVPVARSISPFADTVTSPQPPPVPPPVTPVPPAAGTV